MDFQPAVGTPIQSALQQLSKLLFQHKMMPDIQPGAAPSALSGTPSQPSPDNGAPSPLTSAINGGLSNLFTQGSAQATGLPWLSGGSNASSVSALANLFKVL